MRRGRGAALRRLLLLAALVAVAGCRLQIEVGVAVDRDGSGTVSVGAGLDDDAVARIPDLDGDGERTATDLDRLVRTDDLEATGWQIARPVVEDDGLVWIRAEKPFGTPAEAAIVLAEVAGEDGPFRDFRVSRDRSFASTRYEFEGTVDFRGGLEAFTDDGLADALGGDPLGEDVAAIEQRLGATIDRLVQVRVAVRLPGDVESNAPTKAENGAVWNPTIGGEPVELGATSEARRVAPLVWAGVAVVAGFVLLLALLVRLAGRSRRRAVVPPS